jgi:hypothetical protein
VRIDRLAYAAIIAATSLNMVAIRVARARSAVDPSGEIAA